MAPESHSDGRLHNAAHDAPVSAFELYARNREQPPEGAGTRPLDDRWAAIVDTARIRTELGFRPIYPSVWTARDAGAM